jgi:hypothetical protein
MKRARLQILTALLAAQLTACGWGGVDSAKLDLAIQAAYVTQGTQSRDGTVPLVEGRDGWVRVLVTADQPSNAWPDVRVTLFEGLTPVTTLVLPAAELVPFETSEGSMTRTWNVRLPGTEIVPGRSLLVELDPTQEYADRDRSNNAWPAPGAPRALDVRTPPPLEVLFVPLVVRGGSGRRVAADITDAKLRTVEATLRSLLPISTVVTSVHVPVETSIDFWSEFAPVLTAYEVVRALRTAEQPPGSTLHYVAILPWEEAVYADAGGLGAVAGYQAALWDYGFEPEEPLVPHELGHNFGLFHTPCTPPGYASAHLGVWGMDVAGGAPKDPGVYYDLMSYCTPVWISDYSYALALELRDAAASPLPSPAASAGPVPSLLLSGRLDAAGTARLSPPTLVSAPATEPSRGEQLVEARDAGGRLVAAARFEPGEIADAPSGAGAFAVMVPIAPEQAARIEELRWIRGGQVVARRHGPRPSHAERDDRTGQLRSLGR